MILCIYDFLLKYQTLKSSEYKHCFNHIINMNLRKKILSSISTPSFLAFYISSTDGLEKGFVFKLITVVLSGCGCYGGAQGLGSVLSFVRVSVH